MPANDKSRCILLDRDGVLNRDLSTSVCSVAEFELLPGSAEAIARLHRAGFTLLVITNQACVGRGDLAPDELERIHRRLIDQVDAAGGRIDDIFVCAHTDADACDCRKPKPGLIHQAQAKWGFEPGDTWFVGDARRDVQAAEAAGCRPVLVRTGKGEQTAAEFPQLPAFDDLLAFAQAALRESSP